MEPIARRPRAARENGRARLAAQQGGHDGLASPAGGGEPARGKVLRVRARLPRVRPGRLAQSIAGGTARLQPGRLARGISGGAARLQPGRLGRGLAGRTAWLQRVRPGRLTQGIAAGTARLQRVRPRWVDGGKARGNARVRPGRLAHGITRGAEGFWRRHPREATAIILMALAGVAYPVPFWWLDFAVWLAGAGIAASSRLWDLRDKWVAVVGPVAFAIVGTSIALAIGGTRGSMSGYVHEALAESLYMIKFGSLAGAGYLIWRVYRGRRSPRRPPWQRWRA